MKQIYLGSALILLIGPSGAGKSHIASKYFEPGEIISLDTLCEELTGDFSTSR